MESVVLFSWDTAADLSAFVSCGEEADDPLSDVVELRA